MAQDTKDTNIAANLVLQLAQELQRSVTNAIDSGLITETDIQQFIESVELDDVKPQLNLLRTYCRESSLTLGSPDELQNNHWEPQLSLEFSTHHKKLSDDIYEVTLTMDLETRVNSYRCYSAHYEQGGQFNLTGLNKAQLAQALSYSCSAFLYPYIYQGVTNMVKRTGFQLNLPPIDFVNLYQKAGEQRGATHPPQQTLDPSNKRLKLILINGKLHQVTLH